MVQNLSQIYQFNATFYNIFATKSANFSKIFSTETSSLGVRYAMAETRSYSLYIVLVRFFRPESNRPPQLYRPGVALFWGIQYRGPSRHL